MVILTMLLAAFEPLAAALLGAFPLPTKHTVPERLAERKDDDEGENRRSDCDACFVSLETIMLKTLGGERHCVQGLPISMGLTPARSPDIVFEDMIGGTRRAEQQVGMRGVRSTYKSKSVNSRK